MSISLLDMNPLNNDNNNNINHSGLGQENTIQGVNKDDNRVSISISRKAYDILLEHTKQLNRENVETQKPFTIEEVLDEEIILLFGDEWNKKSLI